jgi:hypothetical protein
MLEMISDSLYMNDFVLVVEGESDRNFLKQLISFRFDKNLEDKDFILLGGNETAIDSKSKLLSSKKGLKLYFILDADSNIEEKREKTVELIKKSKVSIEGVFYTPNNLDKGNLEDLLSSLVPESNAEFIQCLRNFKKCVDSLNHNDLRKIDEKVFFYMYQDSFIERNNAKGAKRNYLNKTIWNLNSPSLNPLIQFLSTVLK